MRQVRADHENTLAAVNPIILQELMLQPVACR